MQEKAVKLESAGVAVKLEPAEEPVSVPKPIRFRIGTRALREIRYHQRGTDFLIPKASFQRIARAMAQEVKPGLRWEQEALLALQEGAEDHVVKLLQAAQMCGVSEKKQALQVKHIHLAERIKEIFDE